MTSTLGIDELLTTTRSIRRRLDLTAPVDHDEITECLRIALQAPSGSNQQSWHWIVVTDSGVRARIGALYADAYAERRSKAGPIPDEADRSPQARMMRSTQFLVEHMGEVPVLVLPLVRSYLDTDTAPPQLLRATMYGSILPAVWNLQLALRTRGYGTCLTTLHLMRQRETAELLGIPEDYTQVALLPVARISGDNVFTPAPRRPMAEVVSYDHF